jgi:peptidoglycan hydrolase CwlO-like protein
MVDVPGDKFNLAALGQESDHDLLAKVYKIMSIMLNFVGLATKDDINRIDARIDKVDAKIDAASKDLNARIDKVDAKIDAISKDLNARIDKVDAKIDAVSKDLNGKIDAVSKDLNGKIDALGNRMWYVCGTIVTTIIVVAKFFAHS